jgi:hypothetical protein
MIPRAERCTFHTLAGAFAARMRNTPLVTTCVSRYSSAIRCLRSPAVQKISGTPFAVAHALTRRANRPAIRIRCVLSSRSSLPPCNRRHQHRNPPGLCPTGKKAFSTTRSTQS